MFTLTSAAARQIQQAATAGGASDMALRVAARPEADGSIQYGMGFDDATDNDMKLVLEGVAVLIAAQHQDLLDDTTLDFVELEPGEFNFIFMDASVAPERPAPATSAGGCGSGGCASGGCASKGARP